MNRIGCNTCKYDIIKSNTWKFAIIGHGTSKFNMQDIAHPVSYIMILILNKIEVIWFDSIEFNIIECLIDEYNTNLKKYN